MAAINPNRQLAQAISRLQKQLNQVADKTALMAVLEQLALLPQPIRYSFKQRAYLCSAGLLLSLLMAVLTYQLQSSVVLYYAAAILALCSVVPLLAALYHLQQLKRFTEHLYWKNALLDNNLSELANTDWPNVTRSWQQQFAEFRRGNHQREFRQLIRGHFSGAEHQFSYHYWHFHYVNKRTQVTTNSKGQVQTRTVYDHFDRYGLIIPFAYCRDLFVTSFAADGITGERYTSDSGRFNKIFQVRAAEPMQAARFLKPAVIVALEQQARQLKQLNLAFSHDGQLCISFADNDMLQSKAPCGLDQLAQFRQSIEQPTALPKLSQLLATVHQLLRHSDSNF
ncbi:hypothetical protein AAY72_06000 [Alishewanella sp. WH16-1]|uniref:DUF3137 domain-containing protein n=1 Tax=Alishewanella sp. WH16-1 TaxID=1651088 RepID=UPI00070F33DC|nr:DUF3137 domain-containing protein [Alishewanella sp. WH16-1]KRS21947.1 hypothetical protein AAY72_06000 [Alishewanella sp. WH16-1]